jgi:hypothetical protein
LLSPMMPLTTCSCCCCLSKGSRTADAVGGGQMHTPHTRCLPSWCRWTHAHNYTHAASQVGLVGHTLTHTTRCPPSWYWLQRETTSSLRVLPIRNVVVDW